MKARALLAGLAIIMVLVTAGPSVVAQEDLDYRGGLERIAERLATLFPKVEGVAVAIEGDQVIVDLGQAAGIHEGAELTVFRKGKAFHHPYTGVILGHFEDTLGTLRIRQVQETYSVAQPMGSLKASALHVGDGVRITAGQVKLAVLPFLVPPELHADEASMGAYLAKRLRDTKRFSVVEPDEALVWLLKIGLRVEDLQQEAAMLQLRGAFPAAYLLYTSLQELRGKIIIDAKLMSVEAGQTLDMVSTVVDEVPQIQVARNPRQHAAFCGRRRRHWRPGRVSC